MVVPLPPPDRRPLRHRGDGWVDCGCGAQHWGVVGAAGLLLTARSPDVPGLGVDDGEPYVLLQHRALWSHHGGTWGIPGGALAPGESPVDGALREAVEEAGVPQDAVRVWASSALVHPDWTYTTIVAEASHAFRPRAEDGESVEVAWVPAGRVPDRPLLPAFAAAWPEHVRTVTRRVLVVVDGANVVGSRPDGWWRDRSGAAARLHAALVAALPRGLPAAALDLPADRWWPDVALVLEGAARSAPVGPDAAGPLTPGPGPAVVVVRAPADGDAEIRRRVAEALRPGAYTDVVVATADRALADAVRAVGAGVCGPRTLIDAVGQADRV